MTVMITDNFTLRLF